MPYINTDKDWTWLQEEASNAARWLGYVPFERIRDERNAKPEMFVPEFLPVRARLVRGDAPDVPSLDEAMPTFDCGEFVARQPYRIVFIGEKSSLSDVLHPIAERIGGELLLPTGEISTTQIAELAARIENDGRPAAIFYFSDFDPSGNQMPISASRKLQAICDLRHPDIDIELHVACLTLEQVVALDLPSTPLKATERRGNSWQMAKGRAQTEIDALTALRPDALRAIAEAAIRPFYDPTLEERTIRAEALWRRKAADGLRSDPAYPSAEARIGAARNSMEKAAARLAKEQQAGWAQLRHILAPPIVLPKPQRLPVRQKQPLFTTDDDFVTASEKLIARKGFDA